MSLLVAAAGMTVAAPARPLRLEIESTASAKVLNVIGESPAVCGAQYTLEITSGGSGNHSVQRGSTNLRPGQRSTIATVRIGGQGGGDVHAILSVQPCGGTAYEERWSSDASTP